MLCATVLAGCGHVRVLATSRESLGITGEAVSELGPMGRDASELFLSRAAAVQPQWRPEPADHPVIERICAELDGIPLAIELAAAQLRVLSLDQIAGSLGGTDDRFGVDDRFGMATAAAQPPAISGSFARAQAVYESCRIGSGPDPTHGACGEGQRGFEPLGGQAYIPDDCAPGKPQDASGDPVGDCILGLMNGRLAALAARYEQHSRELAAGEYVEGMPDVQAVIDELTLADTFVRRT